MMELNKFEDAEKQLKELTEAKPDDITLKLAFASLYKKMNKEKQTIFKIYDSILVLALSKNDIEMIKKHLKFWIENLSDEFLENESELLKNRFENLSKMKLDDAHIQSICLIFKIFLAKSLFSFKIIYQLIREWMTLPAFDISLIHEEFENRLFGEFEMESSLLIS